MARLSSVAGRSRCRDSVFLFRLDGFVAESAEGCLGTGWIVPGLFLFYLGDAAVQNGLDKAQVYIFRVDYSRKAAMGVEDEDAGNSPGIEGFEGPEIVVEANYCAEGKFSQNRFYLSAGFITD